MNLIKILKEFEEHFQHFIEEFYNKNSTNELHQACLYALKGQGKRVRATLVLLCHQMLSGDYRNAFHIATAVEMVHCYSLVHDDLPLMDNDDYRRGRLTTHKVFCESVALLVGDGLLSDSFSVLLKTPVSDSKKIAMVQKLSEAIGSRGMVLGQYLDMAWTDKQLCEKEILDLIHLNKTAKLLASSCQLGAISSNASEEDSEKLYQFGLNLGMAFQIIDDLLDEKDSTGKTKGKDLNQNKTTYLSLLGREKAYEYATSYTKKAFLILEKFSETTLLKDFSNKLLERIS